MMSEILGDMLEDDLREFDIKSGENRAMAKPGRSLTVILSAGQIDRISFLWNDVIVRATKLQHAYLKALEGEEVSA